MATLLAEIYGPDAETRRRTAETVEAAFRSVPFVVDVDNSYGTPARRIRATISTDDVEFFHVEESDVFDTLGILGGGSVSAIRTVAKAARRFRSGLNGRRRQGPRGALADDPDPGQRVAGGPWNR